MWDYKAVTELSLLLAQQLPAQSKMTLVDIDSNALEKSEELLGALEHISVKTICQDVNEFLSSVKMRYTIILCNYLLQNLDFPHLGQNLHAEDKDRVQIKSLGRF